MSCQLISIEVLAKNWKYLIEMERALREIGVDRLTDGLQQDFAHNDRFAQPGSEDHDQLKVGQCSVIHCVATPVTNDACKCVLVFPGLLERMLDIHHILKNGGRSNQHNILTESLQWSPDAIVK